MTSSISQPECCEWVGCRTTAVVHLTVAEDRICQAEYHYCRPHTESFFQRYYSSTRFWSSAFAPPSGFTAFDLSLAACDTENQCSIFFLHERGGVREFPIITRPVEWNEVNRLLKRRTCARPLTHDMAASIIKSLKGKVSDVRLIRLDPIDFVYYALLRIETDREVVSIDVRPSDAIIMALHSDCQILVSDEILHALSSAGDKPT